MTPLVVEWRHLAVEGETCERCGGTGANVRAAVEAMAPVLAAQGIVLELREVELHRGDRALERGPGRRHADRGVDRR